MTCFQHSDVKNKLRTRSGVLNHCVPIASLSYLCNLSNYEISLYSKKKLTWKIWKIMSKLPKSSVKWSMYMKANVWDVLLFHLCYSIIRTVFQKNRSDFFVSFFVPTFLITKVPLFRPIVKDQYTVYMPTSKCLKQTKSLKK